VTIPNPAAFSLWVGVHIYRRRKSGLFNWSWSLVRTTGINTHCFDQADFPA
jgi:hypothetical protein